MNQDRRYFSKLGLAFFAGTLLIYAVQWGASILISNLWPQWFEDTNMVLISSMVPMYLLGMPLLIFMITRIKPEGTIGKHNISMGKMFLAFFMCYAIMYVSNIAGAILTTVIGVVKGSPVQNVLADIVMGTDTWILFLFTVICAPIYEELIFRKLLIDRTVKYGQGVAVVLSGLMFGLFHGNLTQFAYAFSLGIFFGFIYVKTGKVRYTIILHMVINFMGSILAVIILEQLDIENLPNIIQQIESGVSDSTAVLQSILPGLMVVLIYGILVFVIVVTGIILLLVHRKKFRLAQGEAVIPKGKRFTTIMVNLGMILFSGFWVIEMIKQLMK